MKKVSLFLLLLIAGAALSQDVLPDTTSILPDTTSSRFGVFYSTYVHKVHGCGVGIQHRDICLNGDILIRIKTDKKEIDEHTYKLSDNDVRIGINGVIGQRTLRPLIGLILEVEKTSLSNKNYLYSYDYANGAEVIDSTLHNSIKLGITTGIRNQIGPVFFDTFYAWSTGRIYTRIGFFYF